MKLKNVEGLNSSRFEHLSLEFEPEYCAVWAKLKYPGRACISPELLAEFSQAQSEIASIAKKGHELDLPNRLRYQVISSTFPGVFNLGGDLGLFIRLIRNKDHEQLLRYAKSCIDILFATATSYGLPFTTIALVQGETLGGGFEAALSANVIIAERSAKFGFPETVFGMFPGMGAYSFLARRIAPAVAKRMITSGKVYSADELFEIGVVDQVVADGRGVNAVHEYIHHQKVRSAGFLGFDRVVREFNPLTYKELEDVITIWVDTAMQLSEKNLRLMEYLVSAQEKRSQSATVQAPVSGQFSIG